MNHFEQTHRFIFIYQLRCMNMCIQNDRQCIHKLTKYIFALLSQNEKVTFDRKFVIYNVYVLLITQT